MTDRFTPNIGADLQRLHRVISRSLDMAIENTPRLLTDPNAPPHEGFLSYVRCLMTVLEAHHEAEEQITFPFFRDRIPEAPYDHLLVQHQEMLGNVREANAALGDLAAGKHLPAATARLAEALRRLDATWQFHIETEESHLTPERVEAVTTPEEQGELRRRIGEFNQQHLNPAPLCVPFVLYNLEVEDRAVMAAMMPPQLTQELVPGPWRELWAPMRPFLLE